MGEIDIKDRRRNLISISVVVILLVWSSPAHSVIYKKYYKGLPDYETNSPFVNAAPAVHQAIKAKITKLKVNTEDCTMSSVKGPYGALYAFRSNVCEKDEHADIRTLLSKLAPSLEESHLTFWIDDLNQDGEAEILAEHLDFSESYDPKHPALGGDGYRSYWLLRWTGSKYEEIHVGPFLVGELHNIRPFGRATGEKVMFVKHPSCTACDPWIYQTVVDFYAGENGDVFRFTYSKDHQSFGPTLEYRLPGRGHSVDANVETRTTAPGENGPHLMQFFDLEEGQDEWWIFTCKGMKCDYEMFLNELPLKFKKVWEDAENL